MDKRKINLLFERSYNQWYGSVHKIFSENAAQLFNQENAKIRGKKQLQ